MVSVAGLLAADTSSEQLPSDALLQTWHRLRLAVLHSIWTASQIAQASQPTQPSDTSEPDAILASSPSSQQASLSSSSTSRHGHLARQLALKTVKVMIFFFFFFWVTGELSTLRQLVKVPNEPGLSPADSRNLLDVVIALRPVIVNHGLDSLQCELSRQVAMA